MLARKQGTRSLPKEGPLAVGDLTATELTRVLHRIAHRIAQPVEPASPLRYLLEGFGTLNREGVLALGKAVLSGKAALPERPEEEAMHEQVEEARSAGYFDGRCT